MVLGAPVRLFSWCVRRVLVDAPRACLFAVPQSSHILRLAVLYIFAQALGMIWLLAINTLSNYSMMVSEWVSSVCGNGKVACMNALEFLAQAYTHYCILRMMYLLGVSFYTIAWESFADFPTLRRLLAKSFQRNSPKDNRAPPVVSGSADVHSLKRLRAQKVVLVAPLGLLVVLTCMMVGGLLGCSTPLLGSSACWMLEGLSTTLLNPEHALCRTFCFVLLVAFCQWCQQLWLLFPSWALVVQQSAVQSGALLGLTGVTVLYLHGSGSLTHPVIDGMLLMLLWMLNMMWVSWSVLKPVGVSEAGFSYSRMNSSIDHLCLLFKFLVIVPALIQFVISSLSVDKGLSYAQDELILVTFLYPMLLGVCWTITYCFSAVRTPAVMLILLALCAAAASGVSSLAPRRLPTASFCCVWLHLLRQALRLFGSETRYALTRGKKSEHARHILKAIMKLSGAIAAAFFCVLILLALASHVQQLHQLSIGASIELVSKPGASELHVQHMISHLRLHRARNHTGPFLEGADTVRYLACEIEVGGLSALDYSLLSLLSYFDSQSQDVDRLLEEIFPAGPKSVKYQLQRSPRLKGPRRVEWVHVDFPELGTSVLAVRGTDPAKLSDFVEDIRLWTDPVALSLLGFVFPTVRIWPKETTRTVIRSVHQILQHAFGLPEDDWSYSELLEHIQHTSPAHKVVLCGHSMGGGVAAVVSALTHHPVVTINPPGVYASLVKHQHLMEHRHSRQWLQHEWVHHQSLSLVVESDWVNGLFDDHGGLVQRLSCDRSSEAIYASCHMLEGTICHLLARCGDPRGRWSSCTHDFDLRFADKFHDVLSMAKEIGLQRIQNSTRDMVEDFEELWVQESWWQSLITRAKAQLPVPVFEYFIGLRNTQSWQSGYTIIIAGFLGFLLTQNVLTKAYRLVTTVLYNSEY